MNKITIVTVTILFFALTSSSTIMAKSERYVSRQELKNIIAEKDAEIEKLKKEIEALKKRISKTSTVNNKPDNQKQVDATRKQGEELGKGKITVLKHDDKEFQAKAFGKPVFEIRLGEHIDEIKKRFKVQPAKLFYRNSDHAGRDWELDIKNEKNKKMIVFTYEGVVGMIAVKLIDVSSTAIERQIATTYEPYMIDTSNQIGRARYEQIRTMAEFHRYAVGVLSRNDKNFLNYPEGHIFALKIDGEKVSIEVAADDREGNCLLFYIYHDLIDYEDKCRKDKNDRRENGTIEGVKEDI